ncbi:MAG: hypothetical protein WA532_14185 [Candidatus Korobacteraceae bacterium]
MLKSITETNQMIADGKALLLAGSEEALSQLSTGNWIGGTIPYFMDDDGAICSESKVFATELPDCATFAGLREYPLEALPNICKDAPENGVSYLILPAGSAVHAAYASDALGYEEFLSKPVVGWVSGVHLSKLGKQSPKVFNGTTGKASSEVGIALHASLPENKLAVLEIVNVFKQGTGDTITFPSTGFDASDCEINGEARNFAEYVTSTKQDTKLPLTANYNGSIVNASIQSVDAAAGMVKLYAPVFSGVEYHFGAELADYAGTIDEMAATKIDTAAFSCNCILNYLYAGLEGKRSGSITGPITFGEIAHQLLNQTIVQLYIRDLD